MHSPAIVRVFIIAACLLGASLYLAHASQAETLPPREDLAALSMSVDGWVGRREPDFSDDIVAVLGVDDYIYRTYSKAGGPPLNLYIGYHTSQREGDTIHSPLNCLPGAGWLPLEQGRTTINVRPRPGAAPMPIEVNRVIIGKGLDRQLVLYWYQSHRRVVASEYWGKIYTVLDAVRYNRTDAALVRVVLRVPDDEAVSAVEADAKSFVESVFPLLQRYLPV